MLSAGREMDTATNFCNVIAQASDNVYVKASISISMKINHRFHKCQQPLATELLNSKMVLYTCAEYKYCSPLKEKIITQSALPSQ